MESAGFFTYMLECGDGTFYTGWTTNVEKRLEVHNAGKGAKYTRARRPVKLLGSWQFESKSDAMKFECWLKKQPRNAKARLLTIKPDAIPYANF